MGISAERLAGYFFTSASKRAASCGEKIDIVSLSGLMHQLPRPRLRRHIHLFLDLTGTQPAGLRHFDHTLAPILAAPMDDCAITIQFHPAIALTHGDSFLSQLDRRLAIAV